MKRYVYEPGYAHCFKNGVYIGFEVDGVLNKNYSLMVRKWIREKKTEDELLPFLNSAGFVLTDKE